MNKSNRLIVSTALILISAIIYLIVGLNGQASEGSSNYDLLTALLVAFLAIGIYYIGLSYYSKKRVDWTIGTLLILSCGTVLIVYHGLFSQTEWVYPVIVVIAFLILLLARYGQGIKSAYQADNEKEDYKSYNDTKAEEIEKTEKLKEEENQKYKH